MSIESYVNSAEQLKYAPATGFQLPMSAGDVERPYVADPKSRIALFINSQPGEGDLLDSEISACGITFGRREIQVSRNGDHHILEYATFSSSHTGAVIRAVDSAEIKPVVSRLEAMNLMVYLNVARNGGNQKPVPLDEAVFSIKNQLELPDDFMPPHLLEMVEGRKIADPHDAVSRVSELPITRDSRVLFLVPRESGGTVLSLDSAFCVPFDGDPDRYFNAIFSQLLSDFRALEKSGEYAPFVMSRLIKQILFSVSRKRAVDLYSAAYDDSKRDLLVQHSLATVEGGKAVLVPGLEISELEVLRKKFLEESSSLAKQWLAARIRVAW